MSFIHVSEEEAFWTQLWIIVKDISLNQPKPKSYLFLIIILSKIFNVAFNLVFYI